MRKIQKSKEIIDKYSGEGYKLKVDNIRKVSSTLINKLNPFLAQSRFSTYNPKVFNLGINLTYKYTITYMGINLWNKSINKRDLVKVE